MRTSRAHLYVFLYACELRRTPESNCVSNCPAGLPLLVCLMPSPAAAAQDIRFPNGQDPAWHEFKPTTPFGSVPVLVLDDGKVGGGVRSAGGKRPGSAGVQCG